MSSERHYPNEIIRLDIGWPVIVSLALVSGTPHKRSDARARSTQTMFTAYKLWYILIDLKHWVMSCSWKHMIRLDNVRALVNQSYRLRRLVPKRSNLHRL